jgi:hypothetical protein
MCFLVMCGYVVVRATCRWQWLMVSCFLFLVGLIHWFFFKKKKHTCTQHLMHHKPSHKPINILIFASLPLAKERSLQRSVKAIFFFFFFCFPHSVSNGTHLNLFTTLFFSSSSLCLFFLAVDWIRIDRTAMGSCQQSKCGWTKLAIF